MLVPCDLTCVYYSADFIKLNKIKVHKSIGMTAYFPHSLKADFEIF